MTLPQKTLDLEPEELLKKPKKRFTKLQKQISSSAKSDFDMWGERFFFAGLFGGEWHKQKAKFIKLYRESYLAFHESKSAEYKKEIGKRLQEHDKTDIKNAVQYCASLSAEKDFIAAKL